MALLKEESYTIEDIYALPDGERAELIDGHIYGTTIVQTSETRHGAFRYHP